MRGERQGFWRRLASPGFGVVLFPLLLPIVAFILLFVLVSRMAMYVVIWLAWLPRGKDTLFVYSDSPIWREYMISEVLPLVKQRAIVLNWSERRKWSKWSLARWVFRTLSGERNYNPMVVVFRPFRRAKTFRYWSAFQDWKHGQTGSVHRLTNALSKVL